MSDFTDMLQSDIADVFINTGEFAEVITYNGDSINALITRENEDMEQRINERGITINASIFINKIDVPSPALGDRVVFDSTTYIVESIEQKDLYITILGLNRFDSEVKQSDNREII